MSEQSSSVTTSKYQHRNLNEHTSIRILELFPAKRKEEPLQGRLREAFLNQKPHYEALSYAWGSLDKVEDLHIDGKILRLTQNCHEALCRLRNARAPRYLWVDSVCIDQESNDERNHQVGMMGDVYENADEVLLWLGQGDENTDYAIKYFHSLAKEIKAQWRYRLTRGKLLDRKVNKLNELTSREKDSIGALLGQEWFSRVWPVQELALSRHGHMICGRSSIPLSDLRKIFDAFNENVWNLYPMFAMEVHEIMWNHIQQSRKNGEATRLTICSYLLYIAIGLESSEPRDKVFAFHGLFLRLGVELPAPDYAKTVAQVYTEAAIVAISNDYSLMIISYLTGINSIEGCPSWVPDWSDRNPISDVFSWNLSNAAGSSPTLYRFAQQELLILSGFDIDTIEEISLAFPDRSVNDHTTRMQVVVLKDWLHQFEELPDFDIITFFTDILLFSINKPEMDSKNFHDSALQCLIEVVKQLRTDSGVYLGAALYDWRLKTTRLNPRNLVNAPRLRAWYADFRDYMDRKVMFRTKHGRVGLGSMVLKEGDRIALFAGCNLPMTIRPEGSQWLMIAQAYVQGIMQGEAWPVGTSLQEFVFC